MIKNVELITNEIQDFSFVKIRLINSFYVSFYKEFGENKSLLEIDFVIDDDNGNRFLVKFHFHNPENIHFESGGPYHQISIEIQDIKDKGWENKRFEVIDYEENTLHFYNNEIKGLYMAFYDGTAQEFQAIVNFQQGNSLNNQQQMEKSIEQFELADKKFNDYYELKEKVSH